VLNKIYQDRILNKTNKEKEYINLKAEILRYIIGRWEYKIVINNLLYSKIIETDNQYIVGEKCRGYKFTEAYRKAKFKKVVLIDNKILQRIYKYKQNVINQIPIGAEYKLLYDNLNKITIDSTKAIKFVYKNYSNDIDKLNSYLISIDLISDKNFFFVVDEVAGRLHTNVSNLPKELRPFLRYEDGKLVNIDIANSQPLLFNILIKKYSKAFSSYDGHYEDVKKYEELTTAGKIYEYLMVKMGIPNEMRQEFKKDVFGKIFYCDNSKKYVYKERKVFQRLFPNVYKIIEHYKKDNYKQLPISLQKAEAEIMIGTICKRIANERPEIFITTIHDSIMTTNKNKNYVSDVILNEFEKNFNLKPTIKIE